MEGSKTDLISDSISAFIYRHREEIKKTVNIAGREDEI